jgi:hypothetical protein
MSAATTIAVTVSPEAAEQVAKLGMQTELQEMIEHTRRTVPELRGIEVILEPRLDEPGEEPGITIQATVSANGSLDDRLGWQWATWKVTTFPPDVCRHFVMLVHLEPTDAR